MGNGQSSEAVSNGRRTPHKLSKPRTINPATNGLLSPFHVSTNSRRNSASRVLPDPYDISANQSLGRLAPMNDAVKSESDERTSRHNERLSVRSLFRSKSSQTPSRRPVEDAGTRRDPQVRSTRPSRANSVTLSVAERSLEMHASSFGLSRAGSRASINYDLNSYEAQRLLNLLGDGPQDVRSVMTENRLEAEETIWKNSNPQTSRDPAMVSAVSITRTNSDMSLFTPMRRRSLMTPGVATRPPEPSPEAKRARARFSLPSTPARRDSMESLRMYSLSVPPPPLVDADSIPRAVTPNEENYQHTGAFKLGTLRIVNGSPVRSPAVDGGHTKGKATEKRDYFRQAASNLSTSIETRPKGQKSDNAVQLEVSQLTSQSSIKGSSSTRGKATKPSVPSTVPQFFPDLHISPLTLTPPEDETHGLQVTSKHTATEDQLFEDEVQEFSTPEVLDVRIDLNAKPLPPRPKLISEGRRPQDVSRSDSGLGASPTSEYPRKQPLAKADSGYSSNVSLYSLSAKPSVQGRNSNRTSNSVTGSSSRAESTRGSARKKPPVLNTSGIVNSHYGNDTSSPGSQRNSPSGDTRSSPLKHLSISGRQNLKLLSQKTRNLMSPTSELSQSSIASERSPMSSPTSPTEPSALSIGTRKPGKFQRLLTGTHQPLTTHATHPADGFDVPPVPQAISAKLTAHIDRLSPTSGKISPVEEASGQKTEETPLLNNGSERTDHNDMQPVSTLSGSSGPTSQSILTEKVFHSNCHRDIAQSASQGSEEPLVGKAFLGKVLPETSKAAKHHRHSHAHRKSLDKPAHHTVSFAAAQERLASVAHFSHRSRSKSMSALVAHQAQHLVPDGKPPSPPDMPTQNPQSRGDHPQVRAVSSRSNLPGGLSRSLPRKRSRPSLSRQASRENIFSYPPAQRYEVRQGQYAAPSIPALGPRRSMGNMAEVKKMRIDHDYPHPPLNQSMSAMMRRNPSTQFQQPPEMYYPQRSELPASECHPSWRGTQDPAQALDPWTKRPISPHWNQAGQYPPSVPRGHFRSFSTETYDQTGYPLPYRVLHSYNSPAYRGVPIWG